MDCSTRKPDPYAASETQADFSAYGRGEGEPCTERLSGGGGCGGCDFSLLGQGDKALLMVQEGRAGGAFLAAS